MAALAVVAVFVFATLPPRPQQLPIEGIDPDLLRRTVRGAYHIHTTRSDGAGSKADVAAAAARAGLQFAILTDHGDGTRPPDPPEYLSGVLVLDAVEISTNGGHYVALGLPQAPYPLGGEAGDVVEDVARLGGFGIVAHPDHPNPELAWSAWDAPVNGLEWINADAEWRNESLPELAGVLVHYLFRPAAAVASVFDRPEGTLERWAALLQSRPVVALAAADAHGGVRASATEEGGPRLGAGPSYDASFRAISNHLVLAQPFTGDARADSRLLLDAIRCGSAYSVLTAVARGVVLAPGGVGEPPRVVSPLPNGATVVRKGSFPAPPWIEVHHPRAPGEPPTPWILANPDLTGCPVPTVPAVARPEAEPLDFVSGWRLEKDAGSTGDVTSDHEGITMRFRLREGERASQFVAAAADIRFDRPIDAIAFSGQASRPMRVSVQLRFPPDDLRWKRSIYLDETPRQVVIPVEDFVAAGGSGRGMPDVTRARSMLFVVDLTNARPGDGGQIRISGLGASARSPEAPR